MRYSVDKFLIIGSDDNSINIRSNDGNSQYNISAFNISRAFVSGNLLKIKEKATDLTISLDFSSNLEAKRALERFWDQVRYIRERIPNIYDQGIRNVIENLDTSGFGGTGFQGFQGPSKGCVS